jgi:hypothetical protein
MIESAQTEMTRLSGPGNSTVCRAKSPVVSTVFKPKVNLPDTLPLAAGHKRSLSPQTRNFISLPHSVPLLFEQSPLV